jgi:anaerobic magnesium-protoporphyrin IX monomethyl ester cyclase
VAYSRWVPTGLAFLAGALRRAGHQVRVHVREEQLIRTGLDWPAADAALRDLITEFQPEAIGLSLTTPGVTESAAIAKLAREFLGRAVLIVAGGPHPTALPESLLRDCPDLDAVVVGEGEETLVELLEKGCSANVAGLVFRNGEQLRTTPPRKPPADLDRLAPAATDLFDMGFYTAPSRWMIRWLNLAATNIRTSRGCTNRCSFCAGHLVGGIGLRFHSVDYVVEQVSVAVNQYGVEAIHFEDDTLGGDRDRLAAICDALRRAGLHRRIRWDGCLRVDQVDGDLLTEMKSAGCIQVEYGFESGSDDSLRRLGKHATAELNHRAVELTRKAGLRIFADIMVGLPGETFDDLRDTVRFLRWARPDIISSGRLCPLPGTPIYDRLSPADRARLDWASYTYLDHPGFAFNPTAMSDGQFERAYRHFVKYTVKPQQLSALLRDTPANQPAERARLKRALARFVLRHPLRALAVPW